jgi:hypothetical protein
MRELFVEDAEIVEEEPVSAPSATSGSWTSGWDLGGFGGTATVTEARPALTAAPPSPDGDRREGIVALLAITIGLAEGRERVSTTKILAQTGLPYTPKAFGDKLRKWGCPVGKQRIDGVDVRGPAVVDLMAAMDRIDSGGPVEVAE